MQFLVPSDRDAPGRARALLAEHGGGLDPLQLRRLQLVVSELVTNAVRHGPGRPIRVEVQQAGDGSVRGQVVDDGADGDLPHLREPGADGGGGYGLHIVDRVAREWGVFEGSTHVWFVLDPPAP